MVRSTLLWSFKKKCLCTKKTKIKTLFNNFFSSVSDVDTCSWKHHKAGVNMLWSLSDFSWILKLSDWIKNIWVCVLKINEGLTCLERHNIDNDIFWMSYPIFIYLYNDYIGFKLKTTKVLIAMVSHCCEHGLWHCHKGQQILGVSVRCMMRLTNQNQVLQRAVW